MKRIAFAIICMLATAGSSFAIQPATGPHYAAGVAAIQSSNWNKAVAELSIEYALTPDPRVAYLLAYANAQGGMPPIDVVTWSMRALAEPSSLDPVTVGDAALLLGWSEALVDKTAWQPVTNATGSIDEQQRAYVTLFTRSEDWKNTTKPRIVELVSTLPEAVQQNYKAAFGNTISFVPVMGAQPSPADYCYGVSSVVCVNPPRLHPVVPGGTPNASDTTLTPVMPASPEGLWLAKGWYVDDKGQHPIKGVDPLRVPLSNIGIADARYLNPRNPRSVHDDGDWHDLLFANDTIDRTFVVTMTVTVPTPPPSELTGSKTLDDVVREKTNLTVLSQCKTKSGVTTCQASLKVPPSTGQPSEKFSAELLALDQSFGSKSGGGNLRTFQVRFFDESEVPSNAKGYFRNDATKKADGSFVPVQEQDAQTKVTPAASVGLSHEPTIFQNKTASISTASPLGDAMHTHFPSAARLDVTQNIGNRANADLSFIFLSSDFGDQNDKSSVIADKYKLSVYALNRITLDFGKYVFATPASKLAISEKGQGGTLTFPGDAANIGISYIAKRQGDSTLGTNDLASADDVLLQVTNINLAPYTHQLFRTVNLFGLNGRDRRPDDPHTFSTTGGELFFSGSRLTTDAATNKTSPSFGWGGSLAVFHSIRTGNQIADTTAPTDVTKMVVHPHAHGTVALLKTTWNPVIDPLNDPSHSTVFVPWSISANIAAGTPARNKNDAIDTSYMGDRAAFAPDLIFLSSLVAPISRGQKPSFPGELNLIGPGLANKLYYAVSYTDNQRSLLAAAAHAFGVPDDDIASRSWTFTVNRYRLLNSLLDTRNLGTELDMQFQIETPKAVKVGLSTGYFMRSHALEPMLLKNVWAVSANVSIAP